MTRKPSRPGMPTTAVGWNWTNSRSASVGAGGAGEQQAGAERAGRVGRARPQRGGAAGGEDRRARAGDRAPSSRRRRRRGRRRSAARRRAAPSSTSMPRVLGDVAPRAGAGSAGRSRCRPRARRGAREWPPSSPSARLPWRSASKRTPSPSRSRKRAGASSHRTSAAAAADEAAAGGERVLEVQLRRVVDARARPRARPGPSSDAVSASGRAETSVTRAPSRAARQRGEEPGRAGAHDDEVGSSGSASRRRYGTRAWPAALAAPRRVARPRRAAATPSGRSGSSRSRREMARTTGSAASVRRGARGDARAAPRRPPGRARRRASRRCAPRAAGAIDVDTVAVAGHYEAALRAAGGAVALVDALLGGEAPAAALGACGRPGHHAEPTRAMGFCFFGNVAVGGAARAGGARASSGC